MGLRKMRRSKWRCGSWSSSFIYRREEQLHRTSRRMLLNVSSGIASLFSQQGKKGIHDWLGGSGNRKWKSLVNLMAERLPGIEDATNKKLMHLSGGLLLCNTKGGTIHSLRYESIIW